MSGLLSFVPANANFGIRRGGLARWWIDPPCAVLNRPRSTLRIRLESVTTKTSMFRLAQ